MIKAGITLTIGDVENIVYVYFDEYGSESHVADFSSAFSNSFKI
jgi:hypothetical protein